MNDDLEDLVTTLRLDGTAQLHFFDAEAGPDGRADRAKTPMRRRQGVRTQS